MRKTSLCVILLTGTMVACGSDNSTGPTPTPPLSVYPGVVTLSVGQAAEFEISGGFPPYKVEARLDKAYVSYTVGDIEQVTVSRFKFTLRPWTIQPCCGYPVDHLELAISDNAAKHVWATIYTRY